MSRWKDCLLAASLLVFIGLLLGFICNSIFCVYVMGDPLRIPWWGVVIWLAFITLTGWGAWAGAKWDRRERFNKQVASARSALFAPITAEYLFVQRYGEQGYSLLEETMRLHYPVRRRWIAPLVVCVVLLITGMFRWADEVPSPVRLPASTTVNAWWYGLDDANTYVPALVWRDRWSGTQWLVLRLESPTRVSKALVSLEAIRTNNVNKHTRELMLMSGMSSPILDDTLSTTRAAYWRGVATALWTVLLLLSAAIAGAIYLSERAEYNSKEKEVIKELLR